MRIIQSRMIGYRLIPDYRSDAGFNPTWWNEGISIDEPHAHEFFSMIDAMHGEVARAHIQIRLDGFPCYRVPPDSRGIPEILYFEVAQRFRGSHYGAHSLELLHKMYDSYPQMAAISFGADGFWGAVGWVPYSYYEGRLKSRTLFLSPS
ncbi:hypothetical protein M2390_003047 [Mycetocola sp. BIGb0189]|uniref:hypothetical protein n=1 Tax=Mycetocola sp. BIGb0189 TaxID=2940604 RepID=UPI0021690782|nr:hypothetical protein [Mycetocola sp. BIGb0189]MCS4277832.1 hypothetical protein [Mycetocola sp. BIGb0189]